MKPFAPIGDHARWQRSDHGMAGQSKTKVGHASVQEGHGDYKLRMILRISGAEASLCGFFGCRLAQTAHRVLGLSWRAVAGPHTVTVKP